MKTKQQAIQEAYGGHWETVKDYVDENGFCNYFPSIEIEKYFFKTGLDTVCYRPKSLQGIENNNGWIKIESDDDLPKDVISCFIVMKGGVISTPVFFNPSRKKFSFCEIEVDWDKITHYQPIEKPKPPIF